MKKILSISIASYNAEKYIEKCLESFLNSDIADSVELLVVNDGSTDNTEKIASEYVEKYPHIVKLINKENGGHGSTINASIAVAEGKYYKVVDADDWVDKAGIESLVDFLQSCEEDLVINPYYEANATTGEITDCIKPYGENQVLNKILKLENMQDINIYMHSLTFKTSILKDMKERLDEKCFYVDMEYTTFPLRHIDTVICLEYPVYVYLLGTATQSMNVNNLIKRRDQHLRVTKRLVEFYDENVMDFKKNVKLITLHRIQLAMLSQYKIYANMDAKEAKKEIIEFDNWMKKKNKEVYHGPVGRFMKIIKFNRATGFLFYGISMWCLKKLKMGPTL